VNNFPCSDSACVLTTSLGTDSAKAELSELFLESLRYGMTSHRGLQHDNRSTQIVLATCHSAGGRQLRDHKFDVVIIDEATQALEAVCMFWFQLERHIDVPAGVLDPHV
jgi:hypothetical protein